MYHVYEPFANTHSWSLNISNKISLYPCRYHGLNSNSHNWPTSHHLYNMNLKLNKADFKSTDSMTKIYRAEAVTPAFSVSVTGHRYLAASDNQELNNLIKIVLDNIASACLKSNKNTQLRFNSALAAGADQLAANVVKEGNESAKEIRKRRMILQRQKNSGAYRYFCHLNVVLMRRGFITTLMFQTEQTSSRSCCVTQSEF